MEWHHTTSPKKKPKKVTSASKVMGTVFCDSEGCKLVDFLKKGETISAARYVQTLNKLRRGLRGKPPKQKTVILQYDNARSHTARLTLQTIQKKGCELLSHPPYSPDLAPLNYHLFGPLKDHLRGHHYETDEAVQEAVRSCLRGAGTDFYLRGIFKILQRWQK
jgi:histone-lysine N-methyltransferase SETMAR